MRSCQHHNDTNEIFRIDTWWSRHPIDGQQFEFTVLLQKRGENECDLMNWFLEFYFRKWWSNLPNSFRLTDVQMCHGIWFRVQPNMLAVARSCTAVQRQTGRLHPLSRTQMQNSIRNGSDVRAIDSRKHDFSANVAISIDRTISPVALVHIWTDYGFCLYSRCWKWRAAEKKWERKTNCRSQLSISYISVNDENGYNILDLVSHCRRWNWTRNESVDYMCPDARTNRTRIRQPNRPVPNCRFQMLHRSIGDPVSLCHYGRADE